MPSDVARSDTGIVAQTSSGQVITGKHVFIFEFFCENSKLDGKHAVILRENRSFDENGRI